MSPRLIIRRERDRLTEDVLEVVEVAESLLFRLAWAVLLWRDRRDGGR
jgi:hypothetical protein